jgi:hypothetical protein
VKLAAVGVGLAAHLCPAHAASVVVPVAVRQDQEEVLPHRVCLLAARAKQARCLKLPEAVYHAVILDHDRVGWDPPRSSSQMGRVILSGTISTSSSCHATDGMKKGLLGQRRR